MSFSESILVRLTKLSNGSFSSLDLLNGRTLPEKLMELVLSGVPDGPPLVVAGLKRLATGLRALDGRRVRVVVFGGGTGVSTLIGGDSRSSGWLAEPFIGLKAVFPRTQAIVCVTDDGGSTGELQKDLPLIGLGDLRHVLLSSIQEVRLRTLYQLDEVAARQTAAGLFTLFNYRYQQSPAGLDELLATGGFALDKLPAAMTQGIMALLARLFTDPRLTPTMARPHCLGNLLLASAIYRYHKAASGVPSPDTVRDGVRHLAELFGMPPDAVLPCTTTPAQLKMIYSNGVQVRGEYKSSLARRGYPVNRVCIDFVGDPPHVLPEVFTAISRADIIVFAPGSLYTSIVPVMQVPGLAQAVRDNQRALKVLAANIWAQAGETDLVMHDPSRRFYVSDLLRAYQHNIPGGVDGLFKQIILLNMRDIPGSILQNYAVEGKVPIYLDRERVCGMGFLPLEAAIFSQAGLADHWLKHDPAALAAVVKALWAAHGVEAAVDCGSPVEKLPPAGKLVAMGGHTALACERYARIRARLAELQVEELETISAILWRHSDISPHHLDYVCGLRFVKRRDWRRCQEWDNIYSFFNPADGFLNIREDIRHDRRFEVAFLVAVGQSLLGNYCLEKKLEPLQVAGGMLGKIYRLKLRPEAARHCFFTDAELRRYLTLARMRSAAKSNIYTRLLNGDEGFTPPGLLFGLTYAWYIDNRFSSHIEYKMAIARAEISNAVLEQIKTLKRRQATVDFFRDVVFGNRPQKIQEE